MAYIVGAERSGSTGHRGIEQAQRARKREKAGHRATEKAYVLRLRRGRTREGSGDTSFGDSGIPFLRYRETVDLFMANLVEISCNE